MSEGVQLRACRVCLDPTPEQLRGFAQNAGAARWAYNYARDRQVAAHQAFVAVRGAALAGIEEPTAEQRKAANAGARKAVGHLPCLNVWALTRKEPQ